MTGDKFAFFRQSGWMIMATVASGVFMTAVHIVVSKPMLASEYAVFYELLRVFLLMSLPAGGLQVVFAQQAAAAVTDEEERRLSQATRAVLRATFFIWLTIVLVVFIWRKEIVDLWKISNPAALWVTVMLGLVSLWLPVLKGILQGRQNFAGLGWVLILDGVGRFTAIVIIVQLGGQAAGGMTGALTGQLVSLLTGAWLVRHVLIGPGADFDWTPWLRRVVLLTLGVGTVLFMSNADVIYVQTIFSKDQSFYYTPAAMIGLAMVTFTTPLASVMFPKIVQSAARTQQTDALRQALAVTALLGGVAALACTLLPELPLRIIYIRNATYWKSAPLIPWIAWALLPLILANVLMNNLLARDRFRVVPWAVLVAAGYGAALLALRQRMSLAAAAKPNDLATVFGGYETVIGTLGVCSALLLVVAMWFTFRSRSSS
jgi:O-antigen/teichoic acid export membrane protein